MDWQTFYIAALKLGYSEELAAKYADFKIKQLYGKK
jgi:hypothetical protein